MTRKSFILHLDMLSVLDEMNEQQAGKLFKAIKAYHLRQTLEPGQDDDTGFDELVKDFVTRLAFAPFKAQFERDALKYDEVATRNRVNGKKGGRPKKENPKNPSGFSETQENPEKPKKADSDNDSDSDKNNNPPDGVFHAPGGEHAVPYPTIMEFWNRSMDGKTVKKVSSLNASSKRGANVRARFKEFGLEKIYAAIQNVANSLFLNGRNSRNWTASFDWVFLPNNFPKVLEGNYNQAQSHHVTTSTTRPDTAADERQQRQLDIANYVARNIGCNAGHPGGSGTDMPI